MAQLVVRNIEENVKRGLRRRAKKNGRSMEEEARVILREAVTEAASREKLASDTASDEGFSDTPREFRAEKTKEGRPGFGTRFASHFAGKVPKEFRVVEMRGKVRIPDFSK